MEEKPQLSLNDVRLGGRGGYSEGGASECTLVPAMHLEMAARKEIRKRFSGDILHGS